MHRRRHATAAALFLIGIAPAGCGPSEAELDAAAAPLIAEMDAQADRDLEETLSVIADAEAALHPRTPAPPLNFNAFRGKSADDDADATDAETQPDDQSAAVEAP